MGKCIRCYHYNEIHEYCQISNKIELVEYLQDVTKENDCIDYEDDIYNYLGLDKPY